MDFNSLSDVFKYAITQRELYSITIELLNQCNWRCKHCYLPKCNSYFIKKEKVISLLEEARKEGVIDICFTGGEIFLRKDIFELIQLTRSLGFSLTLYSNGSLLNKETISFLKKMYITAFACTLFSMDSKIHDSLCGVPSAHVNLINNIMMLKESNIPVRISVPLLKENYKTIMDVYQFCIQNNFSCKIDPEIYPQLDGNKIPTCYRLDDTQLQAVINNIDMINGFEQQERKADDKYCPAMNDSIFIAANGDIYPCIKFPLKIDNIYDNSVFKAWNNEKLIELQNETWGNTEECMLCNINNYCVKCPGVAYLENKSNHAKSTIACAIAKSRKTCSKIL